MPSLMPIYTGETRSGSATTAAGRRCRTLAARGSNHRVVEAEDVEEQAAVRGVVSRRGNHARGSALVFGMQALFRLDAEAISLRNRRGVGGRCSGSSSHGTTLPVDPFGLTKSWRRLR